MSFERQIADALVASELAFSGVLHSATSGDVPIRALEAKVEDTIALGGLEAASASLVLDVGRIGGPEATAVEGDDGTGVASDGGTPLGFDDALIVAKGDTMTFDEIDGTWTIGRATRQDPLTKLCRAEVYRSA